MLWRFVKLLPYTFPAYPLPLVTYDFGKRAVTGTRAGSRMKMLWVCLCPMKQGSGVWEFEQVPVTYRLSSGIHTLAGALCYGNILLEPAFYFTTGPLFNRAKLNYPPIFSSAFNGYIFCHLRRHVNSLKASGMELSVKSLLINYTYMIWFSTQK